MNKVLLSFTLFMALIVLQSFTINGSLNGKKVIKTSKVVWKGYKVTGSHEGTLTLKSGHLSFVDDKLTGGEFLIDMTSINCTDLEGDYKAQLEGHLKSDDFFSVTKYKTSKLVITSAKKSGKNAYVVKANLTIKGITKAVEFEASIYGKKATATLKIDRTEFNVKYGSGSFFDGLKDNMIYDEMDLVVDVAFE